MQYLLIEDNEAEKNHFLQMMESVAPNAQLIATFSSIYPAISWLQEHKVDVIFSDIELPDANAIEVYKQFTQKAPIVLITNHPKFALESYDIETVHFLTKPVQPAGVLKALERIKLHHQDSKTSYSFVSVNGNYTKILHSEILYLEAQENYVNVVLTSGKKLVLSNLTQFLAQLNGDFIRIHKKYAVNLSHIAKYDAESIVVKENILPIGAGYKEEVLTLLRAQTIKRKK
jgi:DNA-binding LytR/AlgR family response regulator